MNQPAEGGQKKLHIDSDWKAQARADKEKLSEKVKEKEAKAGPGARDPYAMPEASFESLISSMVSQALYAMGAIPDPATGKRVLYLEMAQHQIDLIGVLEEKTKGNLTPDEQNMITNILRELRTNFTALMQQVMAAQAQQGMPAGGGPMGGAGPAAPKAGPGNLIVP